MEWAYLAVGLGPMSFVIAVGFWGDRVAKMWHSKH